MGLRYMVQLIIQNVELLGEKVWVFRERLFRLGQYLGVFMQEYIDYFNWVGIYFGYYYFIRGVLV